MNEPLLVESQEYLRCITYQKVNEGFNTKIYSTYIVSPNSLATVKVSNQR